MVQNIIKAKRDMLLYVVESSANFIKNIQNNSKPKNITSAPPFSGCRDGEFHCSSGECIMQEYRCDADADCNDASDEVQCPNFQCPDNSFVCGNGACIPIQFKCDSDVDCEDESDESVLNCKDHVCEETENFQCSNGACVEQRFVCDGDKDCYDGSDEEQCPECFKMMKFGCANGECISKMYQCDGLNDCADGSDEDEELCSKYTSLK